MDENYVIITIDNIDYYIEASRLNDIVYIDNKLVNMSNSSLTLVSGFDYNNSQNTYPRISCNSMSQCAIRSSYNSNYQAVVSDYSVKGNFNMNTLGISNQFSLVIGLLIILIGGKLLWKR